ncbi:GHKL domain-containing protein [Erysipelothrix sp. D19-032]
MGLCRSTTPLPTQTRRENLIGIAQYLGVSFIVLVLLYDYLFINAPTHIENIIIPMTLTYVVSFALILALITRYFKEKNERMLMESALFEANQKNEAYIQSVQDKIETAKLKHDLKNHLITLQSFIENDMNDESLRYIQTLHALPELKSYVNTNNLTINAILNSKISSYPNVRFKVRHDEGRFAIPHDKLTIILGNAPDNAINETLLYAHNPKEIQIVISENHQYIKIYIANKISNPVTMVDGKPINKSGKRVGLGVDNILDAVKFLNGRAMFTSEGDTFQFKVLIPLSSKY